MPDDAKQVEIVSARTSRADGLVPRPDRRTRLISTAEHLLAEGGPEAVTIEAVGRAARVSPAGCRAEFVDRTDLLLAVFDDAADQAGPKMIAAYGAAETWIDGVRGAMFALLTFLDDRPALARFLLVDSLVGDPPMLARRSRVLDELARALDANRPPAVEDSSSAPFGADAVVRTVAAILHGRLQEHPMPSLRNLCGPLTGVVVLPYFGVSAALREISLSEPRGEHDDGSPPTC